MQFTPCSPNASTVAKWTTTMIIIDFLRQLFSLQAFKADFKLVSDEHFLLSIPDAIKKKHFVDWIDDLKAAQTPSWLGLPSAENALLTKNCNDKINKLLKLLIVDNDENYLI